MGAVSFESRNYYLRLEMLERCWNVNSKAYLSNRLVPASLGLINNEDEP